MQIFFGEHLLSWLTFGPALLALILFLLPKGMDELARWVALGGSLLVFALSLVVFLSFDKTNAGYQFVVQRDWLPLIGARYILGIDGISLFLVLLTTFLVPIIVLAAWDAVETDAKRYLAFMLALAIYEKVDRIDRAIVEADDTVMSMVWPGLANGGSSACNDTAATFLVCGFTVGGILMPNCASMLFKL